MVTILSVALTLPTGIEHERCTSPLICTEQAPHCATPQPYLVPVRPTCSRMTHKSGGSASASTSRALPVMWSFVMSVLREWPFGEYLLSLLDRQGSANARKRLSGCRKA